MTWGHQANQVLFKAQQCAHVPLFVTTLMHTDVHLTGGQDKRSSKYLTLQHCRSRKVGCLADGGFSVSWRRFITQYQPHEGTSSYPNQECAMIELNSKSCEARLACHHPRHGRSFAALLEQSPYRHTGEPHVKSSSFNSVLGMWAGWYQHTRTMVGYQDSANHG